MSSGTDGKSGEMTWKTWRSVTRLHQAILRSAHEREIKKLAAECADVNQPDRLQSNKTPLHLAALWSNVNVTKILLRAGGDISARDSDGHTLTRRFKGKWM
jgi:ankyrin repeat protein